MSKFQALTVAEYFAGIGLMRLGLDRAGWQTVFANDVDPKKQQMYRHHFGIAPEFVLGDVHLLDAAAVPATMLATASFPCNDLSLAGARAGLAGEQSSAFWGFIRVLEDMDQSRPPLVLLENVTGFLTSHGGADFHEALTALNQLGYAVDAFIIDAIRFVPQSRQRLFVVGQREACTRFAESPGLFQSELRPTALADFILWHPDVQWKLRDLPPLPRRETCLADILEDLSPNSSAWWSEARCLYLLNQMSPKHRTQAEAMIARKEVSYATVFSTGSCNGFDGGVTDRWHCGLPPHSARGQRPANPICGWQWPFRGAFADCARMRTADGCRRLPTRSTTQSGSLWLRGCGMRTSDTVDCRKLSESSRDRIQ